MGVMQWVQDFLFPQPPPSLPAPSLRSTLPARSDFRPVQDLLTEHDHEMRAIEEIVATIRKSKPDAETGGSDGVTTSHRE